jgi:RIO-like serine/threonine protein kinase
MDSIEKGELIMVYMIHKERASVNILDIQNISQIDTLKAKDYRVLFLLMGHVDGRSFKNISHKKIAKQLEMDKDDVTKSINRLIAAELMSVGSSEHVKDGYKFNF